MDNLIWRHLEFMRAAVLFFRYFVFLNKEFVCSGRAPFLCILIGLSVRSDRMRDISLSRNEKQNKKLNKKKNTFLFCFIKKKTFTSKSMCAYYLHLFFRVTNGEFVQNNDLV